MKIAVIGGGINGLCIAEYLAERKHQLKLYERDTLMSKTSSNTSKLLQGGLRYLETFQLGFVREALLERQWWLEHCPELTRKLQITIPVYRQKSRPGWQIAIGMQLYQWLAGDHGIGPWHYLSHRDILARSPELKDNGLLSAFTYFDGQMDDHALGLWVAARARTNGADLLEHCAVQKLDRDGRVIHAGGEEKFDRVVNVAGPWAEQLLRQSGLEPSHHLQWVRGSHLLFAEPVEHAWLLQAPQDGRVFFVLPWQGQTLVGTTEVRQPLTAPISAADAEIDYLLDACNHYFRQQRKRREIQATFASVRPLLASSRSITRASRESVLQQDSAVLTIYGGKWTSARSLARKVAHTLRA